MIFNSVTFILFLLIVVILFWILPTRVRLWMLLIASCVFYGFWRWEFLSVMFISALTDYFTAQAIDRTPDRKIKKRLLYITLIVNLGLLVYFKYLFFFTTNINSALTAMGSLYQLPIVKVILPFGISFYTFETISYTVDVYRGLIKPEKSFLNYGLFVTFFPKLVAGPIQRAAELMVQLKNRNDFDLDYISIGVKRILYGLFLKVFLADNISPFVDQGFALHPAELSGIDVWTLAFLFGFQIYFDFSAYSHIAVGAARLMGISIPENFNFPYISSSLKDFWKRWHISLSSWIKDYIYLPLTGTRVVSTSAKVGIGESLNVPASQGKKNKALFLTWAIMGLWHGANWTFVLWGVYHATAIFLERLFAPVRKRVRILGNPFIGWVISVPIAMLSWIPFRASNLSTSFTMIGKAFWLPGFAKTGLPVNHYLLAATVFILVTGTYFINNFLEPLINRVAWLKFTIDIIKFTIIILVVFTFLRPISQFIYFQF